MALITKSHSASMPCMMCGEQGTITYYGGTYTIYEEGEYLTLPLSTGYVFECGSCDYADGEPCEA